MEQQNPQMNALNRAFIAVPPVGFGSSPGRLPPSSRFLQTTLPTARVGTQPPIGSHLGGGSNVGVVGAQQQSSPQQPIGAHLGSGGHLRSSNSFQPVRGIHCAFQTSPWLPSCAVCEQLCCRFASDLLNTPERNSCSKQRRRHW